MKKVLITGAGGLIGTRLSKLLISDGYHVNTIGRKPSSSAVELPSAYFWNLHKGDMDERAFEGVSAIIHLAGANIAEKRWTAARKKEILSSRVKSAGMIYDFLKKGNHQVSTFISASAVGYYGDCGDEILAEDHAPGKDFLAQVCVKWEDSVMRIGSLGIREVRLRNGIVLSSEGGALPELMRGIKLGMAGYFNKPDLYYSWAHIEDTCGMALYALENKQVHGAYNATAPNPVVMKDLIKEILRIRKEKALLIPAPAFLVELALGELSSMLLCSQRCSAQKIISSGYKFKYSALGKALESILK